MNLGKNNQAQPEFKKYIEGDYFFNEILGTFLIILYHFLLGTESTYAEVPRDAKIPAHLKLLQIIDGSVGTS